MRRVLFDKNVPYPLRRHLSDFEVKTVEEEGWGKLRTVLIERAEEADYKILITCDQNVRYQQNLTHRTLSMVVLGSNIWPSVKNKLEEIQEALRLASPGSFLHLSRLHHKQQGTKARSIAIAFGTFKLWKYERLAGFGRILSEKRSP